jgi:hypothetical protein
VRFLSVLHPRLVPARHVVILAAEHFADHAGRFLKGLVRERCGICSVIGDQAFHFAVADIHALEQPLRRLHGPFGRESKLAARLLRQRRRREWRRRTFDPRLLLDARDRPRNVRANRLRERDGCRLIEQTRVRILQLARFGVEILTGRDPLIIQAGERCHELTPLALQPGLEVPVHRRPERAALFFTLDDEADGDALHTSGTQPRLNFLPQKRRQRVAVEPIQNAAALLRPDKILVDLARVIERLLDRVLGDLMEHDAAHRHLRLEHLRQVPADGFTFAVRVGGQQNLRRVFHRGLQMRDLLLLVVGNDVVGLEVTVDIDAESSPLLLLDLLGDFRRRFW